MDHHLIPSSPLTQVVFVHDYIQVVFDDACFSIYNEVELQQPGKCVRIGHPGFCDGLVSLMGQRLNSVSVLPTLAMAFDSGAVLSVSNIGAGPEAWEYSSSTGEVIVEENA